jgi:hypothetical protein
MTIFATTAVRRRLEPVARHAYVVPVVRELPAQAPEPATELTW